MKAEFTLQTFDDEHFRKKLGFLSVLEAAFDDYRNEVPESFYFFGGESESGIPFPFGKGIKITVELVE